MELSAGHERIKQVLQLDKQSEKQMFVTNKSYQASKYDKNWSSTI